MICDVFVKCLLPALLVGLLFPYFGRGFQNPVSVIRLKRHTCGAGMFRCGSGDCIPTALVCDGEKNCKDRSDETNEQCINSVIPILASYLNPPLTSYLDKCPPSEFRCDNGKCINTTKRCDNRQDCSDGSDEKDCQSPCRPGEIKCSSTCLALHHVCDGKKDCEDGSDENHQQCHSTKCSDVQLKCKYGACVHKYAFCDGISDCADGSDESAEKCTSPPTTSVLPQASNGCTLPRKPENGEYLLENCNPQSCDATAGSVIGNFAVLKYTCHPGFHLSGSEVLWCIDGKWRSSFPTCNRALCPALTNPTRRPECMFQGSNVNCSEPMVPGTKATIRCEHYYIAPPELSNYDITCSQYGKWSREVYSCTPECGLPNPGGLPFISNGQVSKLAEYPWHVGIYQIIDDVFHQKCGGSIVAPKVIITAAHCFWNEIESKLVSTDSYRITAGKYYRNWKNTTRYFQEAEIQKVEISASFRGIKGLYASDIAVVILKTNFIMNEAVRPICLDLDRKFSEDFKPGKFGVVVGWGYTEQQTQSEELHAITLPYENREMCIQKTKEEFIPFLNVHDKFCVGSTSGKSVCPGDSGGGYAVKFRDGLRYYLMGIVSAGVVPEGNDHCDIHQFSSFTKVSEHYLFIRQFTSITL